MFNIYTYVGLSVLLLLGFTLLKALGGVAIWITSFALGMSLAWLAIVYEKNRFYSSLDWFL